MRVSYAPVQRVRRQNQNEVRRLSNADEKILVESADAQTLDVDVNAEAVKSQIDLEQTAAR